MTRHDTTLASLTQIEPLLHRLRVTTHQQALDLVTLVLAVHAALDTLRAPTAPPLTGERRTRDLLAAAIRAGKSLAGFTPSASTSDGSTPSTRARVRRRPNARG